MSKRRVLLGVNVDHIATLRQARGTNYPDPVLAALQAEEAGADGITIHPREDRRHIQDRDVLMLKQCLQTRMNLEMAVTDAMIDFGLEVAPEHICLVPEKREELTTEGGLDVVIHQQKITAACRQFAEIGAEVSLFIDPDKAQIDATVAAGAPVIELHTGLYAETTGAERQAELARLTDATAYAQSKGLVVNAGHGLHYHNTIEIAQIPGINELNIGHSIVARALSVGMTEAVKQMKQLIDSAL